MTKMLRHRPESEIIRPSAADKGEYKQVKCKRLMTGLAAVLAACMLAPQAMAISIAAQSAFVMDGATGEELFSKDCDAARVPASMTKVLTAYIIYQELEKGTLTLETPITISRNAAVKSRDASYPQPVPLAEGASYTVDQLLDLIMIPSASASCIAMAEAISGSEEAFVARMNETARALGLTATYYNCHGARPNYITARSQALLTKQFIDTYPDILRYTAKASCEFQGKTYRNTNRLVNADTAYAGADGFKTGTISAAGYCITTTATRNGRRVISVVMKSTSDSARFSDSRALLDFGFAEQAKRDASRASTVAAITAQPASVAPLTPFTVSASLSGLSVPYYTRAQWYVNGEPVPGYLNTYYYALNNKPSTLTCTLPAGTADTVTIRFALTMPDGSERAAETTIPVVSETAPDVPATETAPEIPPQNLTGTPLPDAQTGQNAPIPSGEPAADLSGAPAGKAA